MLTKARISEKRDTFEDGREKTYLSNVVPLKNRLGKVIGRAAITLDVTEQDKEFQDKVKELEEKANRSKLYAASIAHEMRTPLTTVDLMSSNLERILPRLLKSHEMAVRKKLVESNSLSDDQIDWLKELPESLHDVIACTKNDIDMMLAQVSQQEAEFKEFKTLSMNDALLNILSLYPFTDDEWDLVDFVEGLDFEFKGDLHVFKHVLFNLIKNALYYIKASNNKNAKVDIWLEPGAKYNIVNFRDTANGIPADTLPHIFESFYTKRSGGTGIGLSLCKVFMEKMNGKISCDSVEGEYTHFKLYFPKLKENQ